MAICYDPLFNGLKAGLEAADIPVQSCDITNIAANTVTVDLVGARKVLRLIEALEDQDDVESVSSNFDIPDDLMAELSA